MKCPILMLSLALLGLSCADQGVEPPSADRRFNLDLKYGIGARNELNTFANTFTKDLIQAGTASTPLVLTAAELDSIEAHLMSIGIFAYPDTLLPPESGALVTVTPAPTYIVRLALDGKEKIVFWNDAHLQSDAQAKNLRDACTFIRWIIEARPEYKRLPEPRDAYI